MVDFKDLCSALCLHPASKAAPFFLRIAHYDDRAFFRANHAMKRPLRQLFNKSSARRKQRLKGVSRHGRSRLRRYQQRKKKVTVHQ
nr:hypothetical protein [Enterobacter sp. R1(2018)]